MIQNVPLLVEVGMFLLAVAVSAVFVAAAWASAPPDSRSRNVIRAGAAVAAVALVSAGGALTGALSDTSRRPPVFLLLVALCVVATVSAALSSFGARISRLPLWALVLAQAFRLPLELVMHRAADAGVMPAEMSFGGYNFDIVTGASALVLGLALARGNLPFPVVVAWNVMGSVLLAIIVGVAFAATPFVAAFGPGHVNTWVLYFPYVWLPAILVQAALFGHIVIFRRLLSEVSARETHPRRNGAASLS
jgi:MFS family permease